MLERHAADSLQRSLWDSLPENQFIQISKLKSFKIHPTTILLKIKPSVRGVNLIETDSLSPLPFGRVTAITCAEITIAYQIVMPKCNFNICSNFATFVRKPDQTTEVNRYVSDKFIAIIGNSAALVAVTNRLFWTSRRT